MGVTNSYLVAELSVDFSSCHAKKVRLYPSDWEKHEVKNSEKRWKGNLPLSKLLEWQRCWGIWQPHKILLCSRFCLLHAGLAKHFSFLSNKTERGREKELHSSVCRLNSSRQALITLLSFVTVHIPQYMALTLNAAICIPTSATHPACTLCVRVRACAWPSGS